MPDNPPPITTATVLPGETFIVPPLSRVHHVDTVAGYSREQMVQDMASNLPCPFCGGEVDPTGWLGAKMDPDAPDGTGAEYRGPECNGCGATTPDLETWNQRAAETVAQRLLHQDTWNLMHDGHAQPTKVPEVADIAFAADPQP